MLKRVFGIDALRGECGKPVRELTPKSTRRKDATSTKSFGGT